MFWTHFVEMIPNDPRVHQVFETSEGEISTLKRSVYIHDNEIPIKILLVLYVA